MFGRESLHRMRHRALRFAVLAAVALPSATGRAADDEPAALLRRLEQRIEALEHRLSLQEDVEKIRTLAFTYGYYADNILYDQVKALFARSIESCEISGYGVFKGLQGCIRMWTDLIGKPLGADKNQLAFGWLAKHYMIKDVITVAPDGLTAKGRFDYLSVGGTLNRPEYTGSQIGVYNLSFVKEDGVWKISKFWLAFDTINYNTPGWSTAPAIRCPNPAVPPDAPSTFHHPFPETGVIPFHYPHPVTGQPVPEPVGDTRYWIGNWPGEFGGRCGKRDPAPTDAGTPTPPAQPASNERKTP